MGYYCKICQIEDCKKHTFLIGKTKNIKEFSGSSPPEVFVGRWNYPNVYAGILSPQETGDTSILSSPELWHRNKLSIPEILSFREKLIYGRSKTNIKNQSKIIDTVKEVAMTHKPISTEFKLKKAISQNKERESRVPLISNAAEVEKFRLQENLSVKPKIDYIVNDTDVKAKNSILELYNSGIENSSIVKLLSVGLLGLKKNRILVPTRWSITAVDDSISKEQLKKIRFYPEIQEYRVFSAEYLGNHYEFLLMPDKWSFEVLEISLKNLSFWKDFEFFNPRKKYAESVTGAYYANRLALTEYLEKIKRQSSCIVFRQISEEYYAPLGVGILRQVSREAFSKQPLKFDNLKEALNNIQSRLNIKIEEYTSKSEVLKEYGKQTRLNAFLK